MRMYDLKQKEVININDGCRLGFVSDIEFDAKTGKITAIIIAAPGKVFGIFCCDKEYCISWCDIKRIGDDIIIVDADLCDILREIT